MLTGQIRNQVDQIWNTFWSGGISNPLSVIEQITYLLFAKRLDDSHIAKIAEFKALNTPIEDPIFEKGQEHLRWSSFKDFEPERKFNVFKDEVFIVPNPGLLDKVVNMIDDIKMEDRDTKGDLYEYMLGKIATAGQNGQFRTPRHIIKQMDTRWTTRENPRTKTTYRTSSPNSVYGKEQIKGLKTKNNRPLS